MSEIEALRAIYAKNKQAILDDYFEFLRFKSVSTEEEFAADVQACANWLESYLKNCGLKTTQWDTSGHPVVFAETEHDPSKPTVLLYNHYDVQPVDPIELWESDPFEPVIRDGEVFARGAQDNKGQCWYTVSAIRYLLETHGSLPVNVKHLIEGEEEAASDGLSKIVHEKSSELAADHLMIVDLGFHRPDKPAISLGIRGIAIITIEFSGSNTDLHSGSHGGLAYNPNRAMAEVLGKLHDDTGRITVPGFYDAITEMDENERAQIDFDFSDEFYQTVFGAEATGGEQAFSPMERAWLRPTLEINGIGGGYVGTGFKTVIPEKCIGKLSMRLVAGQDPDDIAAKVKSYIESLVPAGITANVRIHEGGGSAVVTSPSTTVVKAGAQAYQEVCETDCSFIMQGGSIPIVTELAKACGAEVLLLGYGLPGDKIHAPNEHFGLDRIEKGFLTIARMLQLLGDSTS